MNFPITATDVNLSSTMSNIVKSVQNAKNKIEENGNAIDDALSKLKQGLAALGVGYGVKELAQKIATIRGEFQQLEVAFNTMLGSKEKADSLMAEITHTAAITPFGLQDVANGAKQLLAYGIASEKVNDTLTRLGDVAAGLSIPLNDLVYLYGTTMVQGRMFTQDLRQFQGRGIPIAEELAKQFGVTKDKVGELVTAGRVGAEQFEKAILSMTDKGGKFGGLMEEQSKTITGQISNIEDAIDVMFNNLGKESEGVINTTLSGISYVIEHYEQFGRILVGLIATYGTYKAAVMIVTATKGWATLAEAAHYNMLLLVEKAQKALNATMMKNPFVLIATLIATVVVAMVSMKNATERLREAEENYQNKLKETIDKEEEHRQKIDELVGVANNEALATSTRMEALEQLEKQYPQIFAQYDSEYEKLKNIQKIKEQIAELEAKNSISNPENELKNILKEISQYDQYIYSFLNNRRKGGSAEGLDEAVQRYQTGADDIRQLNVPLMYDKEHKFEFTNLRISGEDAARLEALYNRRDELRKQISKDNTESLFADLTEKEDDWLENEISRRENLKAKMKTHGNTLGQIVGAGEGFNSTFNEDELQWQINKLKDEQSRRSNKSTATSIIAKYEKEYQDALKAYNDYIQNNKDIVDPIKFEKTADALKAQMETAKKLRDKYAVATDKKSEQAQKKAEKQAEAQRKLQQELTEFEIDVNNKRLANQEDSLGKRLAIIESEYNKEKAAIEKTKAEWIKLNKQAGNGNQLTEEQQLAIDNMTEVNEQSRIKSLTETYQAEFNLMRDYMAQYGNAQQKRLSIAEEYDQKIAKSHSEAEKATLKKEHSSKIASIKAEELKNNIDWSIVFGEFGGMFRNVISPVLQDLNAYIQTDEFKNADAASQKAVIEAQQQMSASVGSVDKVSFGDLGKLVNQYADNLKDLQQAEKLYKITHEATTQAEQNYIKAIQSGDEAKKEEAEVALDIARREEEASAKQISAMQSTVDNTKKSISTTASNLKTSMDNVVNGLSQLSSGSLNGAYNGIITFGKGVNGLKGAPKLLQNVMGKVSEKLNNIPIVGWIASILDIFKDGFSTVFSGIIDAVYSAVNNILKDLLSLNLLKDVGTSLINGIGSIFETLLSSATFGKFSNFDSLFGGNKEKVQKQIDKLTESNESLKISLDDLSEIIKSSEGAKSIDAYNRAVELQQQTNDNLLKIAYETSGSHSWKRHSWRRDFREDVGGFTDEQIQRLSQQIGRVWDGDIWSLSPEEMRMLRSNVDMWALIGKANYGSKVQEALDEYIAQAGKLEELNQQLYESMTGISFDSMYDSFTSALLDMTKDSEDAANTVSEYFMKAMLNNWLGENFKGKLEAWFEKFGKAMVDAYNEGGTGELSEETRNELMSEYKAYVEEATQYRNELAEITGYGLDQLQEKVTDISFDNVRDKFKSLLTDMESSTASFTENFTDMLRNALIEGLMNDKYDTMLKEWYNEFYAAMEDGMLTDSERDNLYQNYSNIVSQGIADRNAINEIIGGGAYSQSASAGGWESMGQDTAEELNGRFTAFTELQVINNDLTSTQNSLTRDILATLQGMQIISANGEDSTLSEIRDMMFLSTGYLENISEYTKKLNSVDERLATLNNLIERKL